MVMVMFMMFMMIMMIMMIMTRWCFKTIFIFTSTWENDPISLIFPGWTHQQDDDVDDNDGRSFWL